MSTISLRAVEPADVDLMFRCDNDSDSRIWTDYAAPLSRQQLLEYAMSYDADPFRAGQLRLIAETDGSEGKKIPVGLLDLYDISLRDRRTFAGIYILPEFRRKGLATSVLEWLERYAFTSLGLDTIGVRISTRNEASLNLFRKYGYQEVCVLPKWHILDSQPHDIAILTLKKP